MDPFEEFEIKPLTEGLGFHKKSVPLSEQVKKSGLIDSKTAQIPNLTIEEKERAQPTPRPQAFADLLKALEAPVGRGERPLTSAASMKSAESISITEPLPAPGTSKRRATEMEIPRPETPTFPTLNPRPQTSPLSKAVESAGLKRGAADSPVRMLESAPVAIPSAVLDGIVIFALTLVFLVALMTITHVDLATLIFRTGVDVPTKFAFAALFGSVMLMYVVVARSFFGRTLGEWTFDYQMGDDQQHKSAVYPLRVLWRSILAMITGVFVLPLVSLILNRDVLAPMTGLQLYRHR